VVCPTAFFAGNRRETFFLNDPRQGHIYGIRHREPTST